MQASKRALPSASGPVSVDAPAGLRIGGWDVYGAHNRRQVSVVHFILSPMVTRSFTIRPLGDFSLAESALFGFGQRMHPIDPTSQEVRFDGIMRLAFCLDNYRDQAGAELRQDEHGVHVVVHGSGDLEKIEGQVARVLSLDQDGRGFVEVGERDPVIGRLQRAAPGLRPPLFYSPYEAAVWSVLSTRRPSWQASMVRAALSQSHGATFDLAGELHTALPTPSQLLEVTTFPAIDPDRLKRMHGVARAAMDGVLDLTRLKDLGPQEAMIEVQRIPGIGPFYAALIVIRSTGFVDVLPDREPKVLGLVQTLYRLPEAATQARFEAIAQAWRPWRTWATVLVRAAGPRVLSGNGLPGSAA